MAVIVREKVKGSGEYWVFINHNSRRRSKKIGTKKAANQVKKEVEARLAKGDLGMLRGKCPNVGKYGKQWLDSPLREQTDSTLFKYRHAFELHIESYFGNKRLDEIKRRHVKEFLTGLRSKGLSASRSKLIKAVLSGIFENAIEDEIITVNPCQGTTKYCGNDVRVDISPLSVAEAQKMLENSAGLETELQVAYLVAVRTGIRLGELMALEWSDIDWSKRTLEVSKTYDYRLDQTRSPKNKKTRAVDLSPATVEALRRLRNQRRVASISGLVFVNEKGKRLNYAYLERQMKKITPRPIRFHDLRHTYATLRIAKGDNILDVSKQMGHTKISMTMDQYAHWVPGEHKSQVDELDNLHLSAPYTHPAESEGQ
jgi:integrase